MEESFYSRTFLYTGISVLINGTDKTSLELVQMGRRNKVKKKLEKKYKNSLEKPLESPTETSTGNIVWMSWLQGEEKPFYFADENEFVRYGTVTSLNNDTVGDINTTGTITIKMTDPFRHGQTKTIAGVGSLVINDPQLIYSQPVDKITLKLVSATQSIVANINNSYNLTMAGNYPAGALVVIDMVNFNITINGTSNLSDINIQKTNIFEAKVKNGDKLTGTNVSDMTLSYRVRIL
jgi:phage-related protein